MLVFLVVLFWDCQSHRISRNRAVQARGASGSFAGAAQGHPSWNSDGLLMLAICHICHIFLESRNIYWIIYFDVNRCHLLRKSCWFDLIWFDLLVQVWFEHHLSRQSIQSIWRTLLAGGIARGVWMRHRNPEDSFVEKLRRYNIAVDCELQVQHRNHWSRMEGHRMDMEWMHSCTASEQMGSPRLHNCCVAVRNAWCSAPPQSCCMRPPHCWRLGRLICQMVFECL